ncbi:MAG: hypothetical protein J0I57_21650 [Hyphomicrobium sp.]|uniref:hypothetical protein n=1 Tax=Hyphomicrobium sp. CS1BSMeth3 TaxID=1892844 RepID=UPI000930B5D4|nr:hypothetical protein [Hyphomicrobium sp. CS1BSMeth3]MBN9267722.1 hypothetical protein [Hyphomicrobium sp.]MBN9280215.1 hypothetical protein [Hyphomicrobium sp.]
MRWTMPLLGLAAVAAFGAVPLQQAAADGMKDRGKVKVTRKYAHHDHRYVFDVDPYAYRYKPRGYYPYYNSDYWSPGRYVRARQLAHYYHWIQERPPYFQSWGHPRKDWNQREWHARHHGYIRRNHW